MSVDELLELVLGRLREAVGRKSGKVVVPVTIDVLFSSHGELLVRLPVPIWISKLLEDVNIFLGWLRPHIEVHARATTCIHS